MQRDVWIVDLEMFYYINVVQSDNYYKKDCLSASYIWDLRGINLQAVLKNSSAAGETQHQGSCCTSRTLKLIFFRTSSSRSGFPWSDWLPVFKQRWREKKKKKKKSSMTKEKKSDLLSWHLIKPNQQNKSQLYFTLFHLKRSPDLNK